MPLQRDLLLRMLEESEQGRIEGRTRLQKLAFLVDRQSDKSDDTLFEFIPYHYGPFSEGILHELDDMKKDGLIEERTVDLSDGNTKYIYNITDEGEERLNGAERESKEIPSVTEDVVSQFNSMPISRLLEHVYNKYPQMTKNSKL